MFVIINDKAACRTVLNLENIRKEEAWMDIIENYQQTALTEYVEYRKIFRDGKEAFESCQVLIEHEISIYIQGEWFAAVTCSPSYLTELVLGHLVTEGAAGGIDEIEKVIISRDGRRADVRLKDYKGKRRNEPGGEGSEPVWKKEWIFKLADRFAEGMPLHEATWAAHSIFLAKEDKLLFACEDIGRHNNFDKAVGFALRNEIDLRRCIVYTSGRVPLEIVKKAIRVGLPVLAAKAAPTKEAAKLAQEKGLALIVSARRDSMKIYCRKGSHCEKNGEHI